ncbi:MAG TPA: LCP family protein [Actinomycetota bacterium]|nr:LCP family protein [Actinomycetota bacterium]
MRNPFKRDPDPFAASRFDGMVKGVRVRQPKHRWWYWAALGFVGLLLVLVAYGVYKYNETMGDIQRNIRGVQPQEDELEPFNALLVGSDSRGDLTEEEQLALGAEAVAGERADTIILAHIDPGENRVTMVQFPRDLYVPIAGGGENKINAALEGGPKQLVETITDLTGLEINQYVQVNIAGFRDLVDALGGVELCITEPVPFDPQTGIEITEDELGMVRFDGDRALRFVRSRNFTTGDFARIQNQQKFVAAAINKVTSSSTLLSPTRLNKLADVAGDNLKTDDHTTLFGLRKLAGRLRAFDPEHYEAYVVPNLGIAAVDGASVVLPDEEAMRVLFEAVGDNESPAEADGVPGVEPSTVNVGVYNGSFAEGAAEGAAAALVEATDIGLGPVEIVETANANRFNYRKTFILYDPDKPETEAMAQLVAAAVPDAVVQEGKVRPGTDIAVIVGKGQFRTEPIVQIVPIQLPKPTEPPAVCR